MYFVNSILMLIYMCIINILEFLYYCTGKHGGKLKNYVAQVWKYLVGGDELDDWVNWEVDVEKVIIHPDYKGTSSK